MVECARQTICTLQTWNGKWLAYANLLLGTAAAATAVARHLAGCSRRFLDRSNIGRNFLVNSITIDWSMFDHDISLAGLGNDGFPVNSLPS